MGLCKITGGDDHAMTAFGILFLFLFALSLIARGRRGLVVAIAISAPFYDSSMFRTGSFGVTPFYIGVMLYVGTGLLVKTQTPNRQSHHGLLVWLLLVTSISTLFLPRVYEGVGVVAAGLGLDAQFQHLTPLTYTQSNTAQLVYLTLNLFFLVAASRDNNIDMSAVSIGLGVGVMVAFGAYLMGGAFPHALFDNTPGGFYASLNYQPRPRAFFSEPSHLGGFATTALPFFLVQAFRTTRRTLLHAGLAAVALVLLVLSSSGTAVAGTILGAVICGALGFFRGARTGFRIPPGVVVGVAAVGVLGVFSAQDAIDLGTKVISGKQDSTSLQSRTFSDQTALHLLWRTHGLGVGLGSSRTSSLATFLLADLGGLGTCLFLAIVWRSFRNLTIDPNNTAVWVALVFLLSASAVSLSNFASPILWLLLAVGWQGRRGARVPRTRARGLAPVTVTQAT